MNLLEAYLSRNCGEVLDIIVPNCGPFMAPDLKKTLIRHSFFSRTTTQLQSFQTTTGSAAITNSSTMWCCGCSLRSLEQGARPTAEGRRQKRRRGGGELITGNWSGPVLSSTNANILQRLMSLLTPKQVISCPITETTSPQQLTNDFVYRLRRIIIVHVAIQWSGYSLLIYTLRDRICFFAAT